MKIPYAYLLVGPTLLYALGFFLNKIVIAANGGIMPVLINGCSAERFSERDFIHACMTHTTHLKFLSDWIITNHGTAVYSPGDYLLSLYDYVFVLALILWAALMIKDYNLRIEYGEHRR